MSGPDGLADFGGRPPVVVTSVFCLGDDLRKYTQRISRIRGGFSLGRPSLTVLGVRLDKLHEIRIPDSSSNSPGGPQT